MDEVDNISLEDLPSIVADDAIDNIYKTYIDSNHPKLQATGYIYFAQRFLLESPSNYEKAIKLWRVALKCSNETNPIALYNLGLHYYLGKGIEQNLENACDLFEKAAVMRPYLDEVRNFGVQESCFALGTCYENGTGRSKDLRKANKLYNKFVRCKCFCYPGAFSGKGEIELARLAPIEFLLHFKYPESIMCRKYSRPRNPHWTYESQIRERAENKNWGFAVRIRNGLNEFCRARGAMASYIADDPEIAHREKVDIVQQEIIHLIANAIRIYPDLTFGGTRTWQNCQTFIDSHLSQPINDMKNTSNLDRDARICKLMVLSASMGSRPGHTRERITYLCFLERSKFKYPKEFYFHRACMAISHIEEQYFGPKCGLDIDSTIQQFPNNPDLIYFRAKMIGKRQVDALIKIKAFIDFLLIAPSDHKALPDALLEVGLLYEARRNMDQSMSFIYQRSLAKQNLLRFHHIYGSQGIF